MRVIRPEEGRVAASRLDRLFKDGTHGLTCVHMFCADASTCPIGRRSWRRARSASKPLPCSRWRCPISQAELADGVGIGIDAEKTADRVDANTKLHPVLRLISTATPCPAQEIRTWSTSTAQCLRWRSSRPVRCPRSK